MSYRSLIVLALLVFIACDSKSKEEAPQLEVSQQYMFLKSSGCAKGAAALLAMEKGEQSASTAEIVSALLEDTDRLMSADGKGGEGFACSVYLNAYGRGFCVENPDSTLIDCSEILAEIEAAADMPEGGGPLIQVLHAPGKKPPQ